MVGNIYDVALYIAGVIMVCAYVPQIRLLVVRRTSGDLSIAWLAMILFAIALVDLYALGDIAARRTLLITNTATGGAVLVTLVLSLRYRR